MGNTLENAMTFFLKTNKEGIYTAPDIMVAYANSVRPDVVVPSEENGYDHFNDDSEANAFAVGYNLAIESIKILNPTMTFTELNHTAPTGDKSDEG